MALGNWESGPGNVLACAEASPTELGLVDIECVGNTATTVGNPINLLGATRFQLITKTEIIGGTTVNGSYKVHLEILDDDGTVLALQPASANSLFSVTIADVAATYWGSVGFQMQPKAGLIKEGVGIALVEYGSLIQDDIVILRKVRLSVEVTAAYDVATSVLASVWAQWA